jgi:sigma-E factor negative regulatory protein RseB
MLKPRDKHRYAQRLWADRETGLLLRSDLLGPAGEVLESSAFTDVLIGGKPPPELVLKPMKRLDGYRPSPGHSQIGP